jgi:hypothetical protein
MIDNPLTLPAPTNFVDRVHAFARDLVYGVVNGLWNEVFIIYTDRWSVTWRSGNYMVTDEDQEHPFYQLIVNKWNGSPPSQNLLQAFGYYDKLQSGSNYEEFILTPKAFALLEAPIAPPSVFISYKRSESSTFGLLIEARLKLLGNPNPFIDKNLVAGEEWHAQLEERVRDSRYFVCLVGKTTLSSAHVRQEIEWAEKYSKTIISVWHNGAYIDTSTPPALSARHAITVKGDSALDYEIAVNQLLNSMGYATY